jgi:hypothetical protein
LLVTGVSANWAEETKPASSREPRLTQDMIDDYAKLLEWRLGPAIARAGGSERLRQMIVNDWNNGDVRSQQAFVATVKWWREEFPKLSKADRERMPSLTFSVQDLERMRQAEDARAIHLLMLQQANAARQQTILGISNAAAAGHDVNMRIIDNMRPTGRYEYNPATGRYDRFVPR